MALVTNFYRFREMVSFWLDLWRFRTLPKTKAYAHLQLSQRLQNNMIKGGYNSSDLQARFCLMDGAIHLNLSNAQEAIKHLIKGVESFEYTNTSVQERVKFLTLSKLGESCLAVNNLDLAHTSLYEALLISSSKRRDFLYIAQLRMLLAEAQLRLGIADLAQAHLLQSLEYWESTDNSSMSYRVRILFLCIETMKNGIHQASSEASVLTQEYLTSDCSELEKIQTMIWSMGIFTKLSFYSMAILVGDPAESIVKKHSDIYPLETYRFYKEGGVAYTKLDELISAHHCFNLAVPHAKTLKEPWIHTAEILMSVATIDNRLGRHHEAIEQAKLITFCLSNAKSSAQVRVLRITTNAIIMRSLIDSCNFEQALDYWNPRQNMGIDTNSLLEQIQLTELHYLHTVARIETGFLAKAELYINAQIEKFKELGFNYWIEEFSLLLARIYLRSKRYNQAQILLEDIPRVLPNVTKSFDPDGDVLESLSVARAAQGNYGGAFRDFREASHKKLRSLSNQLYLLDETQTRRRYDWTPDVLLALHFEHFPSSDTHTHQTFSVYINYKGIGDHLIRAKRLRMRDTTEGSPENQFYWRELLRARNERDELVHGKSKVSIYSTTSITDEDKTYQSHEAITRQIQLLDDYIKSHYEALAKQGISASSMPELSPLTLSEIQTTLTAYGKPSALIEFIKYPTTPWLLDPDSKSQYAYGAFVVSSERNQVRSVPLGNAIVIDKLILQYQEHFQSFRNQTMVPNLKAQEDRYICIADELRRCLLDPILSLLEGVEIIFIVPDDAIANVSFQSLPSSESSSKRYLIEDFCFSYLGSSRELGQVETSTNSKTGDTAIMVGDVDYHCSNRTYENFTSDVMANQQTDSTVEKMAAITLSAQTDNRLESIEPSHELLPGKISDRMRKCAENICQHPDIAKTYVLNGMAASMWVLRNMPSPRIMEIDTHGIFNLPKDIQERMNDYDLMANVELAMAAWKTEGIEQLGGYNDRIYSIEQKKSIKDSENWRITRFIPIHLTTMSALHIAHQIDLNATELVVLIACDSGVGLPETGRMAEGMRRALALAGAQSNITALWHIPTQGSRNLLDEFYRLWCSSDDDNIPKLMAFHQAQLCMLHKVQQSPYGTHPWLWAGLVYSGRN